ncbi:MAG: glycosyltransferase family 9 protein [Anaerolineae bacterium]|nr:glycosyltransferase family 9 protein [Anaerolineae bacterium]
MDREALVLRNRAMAEAFHKLPLKHQARRAALMTLAHLPMWRRRTSETGRILLIRPDHLGDVLLTTPAIHMLRQRLPDAEIHALVGPWSADVLANDPALDAVLTLDFPGFSRIPKQSLRSPYELAFQTARQLRRIGYDTAFILRPDHWWGAMVAHLAGIPRRIGYKLTDVSPFLSEAIDHHAEHAVLQSARLIAAQSGNFALDELSLTYPVEEADRQWVRGYLEEWGISAQQRLIAIHPGSGTWVKRWTDERWATVADALHEQLDVDIVFTGADHELPMISNIVARMRHTPALLVGDANIRQLAALYERARVVLGPDSGPIHLAAAVGSATVSLFGPADPEEFGPWGAPERHLVLTSSIGCRPCRVIDWETDDPANHPCVRDIPIEQVLEAARRLAQRDRF